MYSTSDFKRGLKILVKDQPYSVVDFQHVKPGKGNQFTRTKLKNLITGANLELTIRSGERFKIPDVSYSEMTFLYKDEQSYTLMNATSYEQITVSKDVIGEAAFFMKEDMVVTACLYNETIVNIDLPKSVELKILQTDPGFKGNTVSNTFKPATLETGFALQVPLHINEGDMIRVNTVDKTYIERVRTFGKK